MIATGAFGSVGNLSVGKRILVASSLAGLEASNLPGGDVRAPVFAHPSVVSVFPAASSSNWREDGFGNFLKTGFEEDRAVAPMVEQRSPKPRVVGSSPSCPAQISLTS